ncbi:MAG: GTPase Era [Burkholderiales bacterium]|jgi:GTP-binding protein Era|nr:GTPase Era [Burkholderiales bacterium]
MTGHRSGYVAIIGRPNVGKSTLLNRLVGQKISITSRRPQTTRQRIIGIVTRPAAQYVFVDTPGFQNRHGSAMNRLMNRSVSRSIADVNVIVWVVESRHLTAEDKVVLGLLQDCAPVVIAVNKIDELSNKNELLPFMQELEALAHPAAIVPVSAKNGVGADNLLEAIAGLLPEQERLYAEDEITTASERTLAAELVREKLFRLLGEELPYSTAVEIEKFEVVDGLRRINAAILVDKSGQKGIVIGKGGEKLKQIGTQARLDMERLFGGKVFLEVWVKVKSGWADDDAVLKRTGIE